MGGRTYTAGDVALFVSHVARFFESKQSNRQGVPFLLLVIEDLIRDPASRLSKEFHESWPKRTPVARAQCVKRLLVEGDPNLYRQIFARDHIEKYTDADIAIYATEFKEQGEKELLRPLQVRPTRSALLLRIHNLRFHDFSSFYRNAVPNINLHENRRFIYDSIWHRVSAVLRANGDAKFISAFLPNTSVTHISARMSAPMPARIPDDGPSSMQLKVDGSRLVVDSVRSDDRVRPDTQVRRNETPTETLSFTRIFEDEKYHKLETRCMQLTAALADARKRILEHKRVLDAITSLEVANAREVQQLRDENAKLKKTAQGLYVD